MVTPQDFIKIRMTKLIILPSQRVAWSGNDEHNEYVNVILTYSFLSFFFFFEVK